MTSVGYVYLFGITFGVCAVVAAIVAIRSTRPHTGARLATWGVLVLAVLPLLVTAIWYASLFLARTET